MSIKPFNPEDSFDYEPFFPSTIRSKIRALKGLSFKETPEAHVFKADLPGARKEEVNILARDRTLEFNPVNVKFPARLARVGSNPIAVPIEVEDGKRRGEEEGETDTWHKLAFTHHCCDGSECSKDKFRLEYTLPENAKVEQAKASMENGVLTVTIPKEKVQFPFLCHDIEEAFICDGIEEAFTVMNKMSEINHTLWTRVSEQARQIEHLYEQAVEAKETIELGNKELAQAIERNSCGITFLLILLVLLAFCLLF